MLKFTIKQEGVWSQLNYTINQIKKSEGDSNISDYGLDYYSLTIRF
jgi:hypothetical protein